VDQGQYALLVQLLEESGPSGDAPNMLVAFVDHLARKNRAAQRDVPPPGLSEHTTVISAFFVLARLLAPALAAAAEHGSGALASFPAGTLFGAGHQDTSAGDQPR